MSLNGNFKNVSISIPLSIAKLLIWWIGIIILVGIIAFTIIVVIEPEVASQVIDGVKGFIKSLRMK